MLARRSKVADSQPFSRSIIKPPYSSDIANRFVKHDFRAENPDVLSELLSIEPWSANWLD
jgi:hypothetical protein